MYSLNIDIIILTHEYPPYVFGGVATYIKNVAEWLAQKGWKVLVISGKASLIEKIICKKRINSNLSICRIYFPEMPPRWFIYSLIVHEYLKKFLEKTKQDIVVLTNGLNAWLTFRGFKDLRSKYRLITIFHGSLYASLTYYSSIFNSKNLAYALLSPQELLYFLETPLFDALTRNDLCVSDYYVFVAKHVLHEFRQLYKDFDNKIRQRGIVVYPGIEFEELYKLRQESKREVKDKVIAAFVGRLFYSKGVVHAVQAMEYLVKELHEKNIELWIFGKGPIETWLKWYIKKTQLSSYVKLFGFVLRSTLLSILAKYVNVLLHPSLYEAAPLAIIEAQALGIPAITFDLPWAHEFVLHGINGFRAPYPDITGLAEYIIKAIDLNMQKIIHTVKRYDRNQTFKELEALLLKLNNISY
jgi:glycosyltransferase involved in cell wall biosynthesis